MSAGVSPDLRDVSRETYARLQTYEALVRRWTPRINLVAPSTLEDLWARHILDSAQILQAAPPEPRHWVDLGSGGGFPGLVVAIILAECAPKARVSLVESDLRKATFLRTVIRETGIGAQVLAQRAEKLDPQGADVLSARALAPLEPLLAHSARHLAPEGVALFPKGKNFQTEIDAALASWRFEVQTFPSRTEPGAAILKIGGLLRA